MDIKKVDDENGIIIYHCKECEAKYGIEVDYWLKTRAPKTKGSIERMERFFNDHEKCSEYIWESESYIEKYGTRLRDVISGNVRREKKIPQVNQEPLNHPLVLEAQRIFDVEYTKVIHHIEGFD